jgi:hypothetical protein
MAGAPTHAIVVNVTFREEMMAIADDMLRTQVIPGAKAAEGFVAGYWMHSADGRTGTSVELFDSLANAEAELGRRSTTSPPESPVNVDGVAILEIVGNA